MTTEPQSPLSPDERTQFAVLLFTDICDSTALKAHRFRGDVRFVIRHSPFPARPPSPSPP